MQWSCVGHVGCRRRVGAGRVPPSLAPPQGSGRGQERRRRLALLERRWSPGRLGLSENPYRRTTAWLGRMYTGGETRFHFE